MSALASGIQQRTTATSLAGSDAEASADTRFFEGRPMMRVWAAPVSIEVRSPNDHQLRRFWVAAIGPGAVEDLLRLIAAAHERRTVRRPLFLPSLLSAGLVAVNRDVIWVPPGLPLLPRFVVQMLPVPLRAEYRSWRASASDR